MQTKTVLEIGNIAVVLPTAAAALTVMAQFENAMGVREQSSGTYKEIDIQDFYMPRIKIVKAENIIPKGVIEDA